MLLGEKNLHNGLLLIANAVKNNNRVLVIIDSDCDGFTAAALLINYLHEIFPLWTETYIDYFLHEGKQHGLNDCCNYAIQNQYSLVICPDSASNDYLYHAKLAKAGIGVLVLDHHLAESISQNAVVINNQLSDYPNKELSGVGITWQFCRYIDSILNINYADNFLDLVALGNCGDMMSLKSTETRYLITKGFKTENIKNPFISYMIDKNSFPLSKADYISSDP